MQYLSPSVEELAWLHATAILEQPPSPTTPNHNHIQDDLFQYVLDPPTPIVQLESLPRSEWIYRQPKSSASPPHHCPNPPQIKHVTRSASTHTSQASSEHTVSSSSPFWSSRLRPRPRSERSIPLLKTIPSGSQVVLTPPKTALRKISSPRSMSARPPSVASTLSSASTSTSPSSSRSESPVTPVFISPTPYYVGQQTERHRRRPETDLTSQALSHLCPPSKSILTRTSSVSTKGSVHKSVKFAAIPAVHYESSGCWDMEADGIDMHSMDLDGPFPTYHADDRLDLAKLRELHCTTPTPEREKEKTKGLKRLMSLSRKPATTTGTNANVVGTAHKPLPSASPRPLISTPYPLGTFSARGLQSTASLGSINKANLGPLQAETPLRTAPSCDSFRSSKSTSARSIRSLGSVKSTASTRGFRSWLGRTIGWAES